MQPKKKKLRKVHVLVVESGKTTADVRLPFGMFRLGMKYGKTAAKDDTDSCAKAMAQLQHFDCPAFEHAVISGERTLPCILLDATDAQSGAHVVITAE